MILRTFFFFNDTATTEIYTLSLHDALPIFEVRRCRCERAERIGARSGLADRGQRTFDELVHVAASRDRKSTRLNSSHANISYAVFCLKKKNSSAFLFIRLLSSLFVAFLSIT